MMASPLRGLLLLVMPLSLFAADFPPPAALPLLAGLPDPLVMANGQPVTTREQWLERRAPELSHLFQHYEYGRWPDACKKSFAVERDDPAALGGRARLKEVTIQCSHPSMRLHLLLVTPAQTAAVPVFVGLNFSGNHELLADPKIRLPDGWMRTKEKGGDHVAKEADRGKQEATWNIETIIARGYGLATFYYGDVVPDDPVWG